MFVSEHTFQRVAVISLAGRFDKVAKPGIEAAILGAQEAGYQHIILNFTNVSWADRTGLDQLFMAYQHLSQKKVRISLVNPQPAVRSLLERTHISSIAPIYSTEAEAWAVP